MMQPKRSSRLLKNIWNKLGFPVLFLCLSLNLFSQGKNFFHSKLSAGVSGSQLSGDTYSGFNQPGAYLSVSTGTRLNSNWDTEIEFAFSQRGARRNPIPEKSDFNSYDLHLNYLDFSVSFFRYFKDFSAQFGLTPSYLLNYSEENQFGPVVPDRPFHEFTFHGFLGAGYFLAKGLSLDIRYSNSIVPARPHQSGTTFRLNLGQYNSSLQFLISYRFLSRKPSDCNCNR